MKTTPASKVLAPYGSVQFVKLATKVGAPKDISAVAPQRRVVRLKTAA
jgi:hypothetical protein